MLHLTCLVHALHRIADHIRGLFPQVDKLVSNVKKIFRKAPARCKKFKQIAPEVPLPPEVVLTRWGTWLNAVKDYVAHYEKMKQVIAEFDGEDALAINTARELFDEPSLRNDLSYIAAHFVKIAETIAQLEERNMQLPDALRLFDSTIEEISQAPGEKGDSVLGKFGRVISANVDLDLVRQIGSILTGKSNSLYQFDPNAVVCLKYAPLTSVEVERSFSTYKNLLSEKRQGFSLQNIKKLLVIICNQRISG